MAPASARRLIAPPTCACPRSSASSRFAGFDRWLRVEPATGGAALLSDRRRRQEYYIAFTRLKKSRVKSNSIAAVHLLTHGIHNLS
uniref:Uncharacterized protein n=1 Tax=Oryza punctata TaxID=4537 RepID=A0A0E0JXX6_ORYPU